MPKRQDPENFKNAYYGTVLARNVRACIEYECSGSVNAWVAKYPGLSQSTVNKIANGTQNPSVSVLEGIAEKTGYAAWQLLHPDFSPRTMPKLMDARAMRVAAIYSAITDEKERKRVGAIMEQFATEPQGTPEGSPKRTHARSP